MFRVMVNTAKLLFKKKSFIIIGIVSPAIVIVFFSFAFGSNMNYKVGIIDKDNSYISKDIINVISNIEDIDIVDIKKVFNIIPIKLFSILKVFEELSLLEFDIKNDDNSKDKKLIINLLPKPDKKLNLDESKILNNLKLLSKEYQESY